MPFALWSIFIAACLPLCWAIRAKVGAPYDNHCPRVGLAQADGVRARANWAQQNAWEAFAPYAAAMLVGFVMKVPAATLDVVAVLFLLARLGHGLCYLRDWATARSLCWFLGMSCVLWLFVLAAMHGRGGAA